MRKHDRTRRDNALVYVMPGETLGEVATLLEETLKVHRSVKNAVLCTKEGVVVAAVARGGEIDPRVIATVSSALVWGGASALHHLKSPGPTHLVHTTSIGYGIGRIRRSSCRDNVQFVRYIKRRCN